MDSDVLMSWIWISVVNSVLVLDLDTWIGLDLNTCVDCMEYGLWIYGYIHILILILILDWIWIKF